MKISRRALTLIEVMIVVFLIGIIGSVIGYNMKGSLDEGRSFKCEQGSKQVYDLLMLAVANGTSLDEVVDDPKSCLMQSGFVKSPDKLIKDGWGNLYDIHLNGSDDILVTSEKWKSYLKNKKNYSDEKIEEEYPWAFSDRDNL